MSKDEVTVWTPSKFEGTDMLPTQLVGGSVDRVGRENIQAGDLILPTLSILQGMSDAVTQGIPGARPGRFYHSASQEIFDGPVRVLACSHTRSRALFPKPDRREHSGLQVCLSKDGRQGTVYGDCDSCTHEKWGDDGTPPACSESHNFTVLTSFGPAIVRFSRTGFKSARNFLTTWNFSRKALWAHPVILTTKQQSKSINGKQVTYFPLDIRWAQREDVPPAAQAAALEVHQQVKAANEQGRFDTQHSDDAPDL